MNPFNVDNGTADRSSEAIPVASPTACPTCRSHSITTTARKPDENTYWRCHDCGEVWNACRRETEPAGVRAWR